MDTGCSNSVFRYNISANDGGGTRYLYNVSRDASAPTGTNPLDDDYANPVDPNAWSYTGFDHGQSLIHYVVGESSAASKIPVVYNNTFYVGDGIDVAVYGNTSTGSGQKYVRFYNNIVLKDGSGTIAFNNTHNPSPTNPQSPLYSYSTFFNPSGGVKNNIFYAMDGQDSHFTYGAPNSFSSVIKTQNGNLWQDPKLDITVNSKQSALRTQRDTVFPKADYNSKQSLEDFVNKTRVRARAAIFAPTDTSLDTAGLAVNGTNMDGASTTYFGPSASGGVDFFGKTLGATPPIGAALKP
jgi:hypothetical protein